MSFTAKPSLLEAVGSELLEGRDLKAIAKASLDYLNRYLRAETSLISLGEGERQVVLAAAGPNLRRLVKSKYAVEGALAELLRGQYATLHVPDASAEQIEGFGDGMTEKLIELGARSLLVVAVGECGLIALADPDVDAFTSFDEAGVTGVAAQLNYIFGRIHSERELENSAIRLKTLLDSISRAQATGDLTAAMQTTVAAIVDRASADSGSFMLLDEETGRLVMTAAVGTGRRPENIEIEPGEGIAGWVALHKKPLSVNDVGAGGAAGNGVSISAALSLPVVSGEDLIGVLNLGAKQADHEFTMDDLGYLISTLASIGAGMAAERGRSQWQALYFETIRALVRVIESRNPFSVGHSDEVAKVARRLAEALGLEADEVETIELAALLHDVGVAVFADDLLGKDRTLNSAERLILRGHPLAGSDALAGIEYLRGVLPLILHHHENYDGSGYVEGLEGENIPFGARVLSVAEAYVAMINDRPHRGAKSGKDALEELKQGSGKQFDPEIVKTFCSLKLTKL